MPGRLRVAAQCVGDRARKAGLKTQVPWNAKKNSLGQAQSLELGLRTSHITESLLPESENQYYDFRQISDHSNLLQVIHFTYFCWLVTM